MSQGKVETVEIEVLVSGVTFGPYTPKQAQENISEGLLAPIDKARLTSAPEWSTLQEVLDQIPPEPEPAPVAPEPEPEPTPDPVPAYLPETEAYEPPELEMADTPPSLTPPAPPEPKPAFKFVVPSAPAVAPAPVPDAPAAAVPAPAVPISAPQPPIRTRSIPLAPTRPLAAAKNATSLLGRVPPKTGGLPVLAPNSAHKVPSRVGGIRSQILARTSNEPLRVNLGPEIPRNITRRLGGQSTTAPLPSPASFAPAPHPAPAAPPLSAPATSPAPSTVTAPIGPSAPKSLAAAEPGRAHLRPLAPDRPRTPVLNPLSTVKIDRFTTRRPKLEEENETPQAPPPTASPLAETAAMAPLPPAAAPVPPPEPLPDLPPPAPEPEPVAEDPALANPGMVSPATRSVSVAALASGTMPLPAITKPKPPDRPPTSTDSILAIRLPARRTQVIKAMPGAPVKASEAPAEPKKADPALEEQVEAPRVPIARPSFISPPQVPAANEWMAKSMTAPLTAPSRIMGRPTAALPTSASAQAAAAPPASAEVTPAPPPAPRPAANPVRRRSVNPSALAATTLLPSRTSATPSAPPEKEKTPVPAPENAPAKHPFQPLAPPLQPSEDEDPADTPRVPLVESRRAALRQARLRRKRQGMIYTAIALLFIILLCLGIYHYTSYVQEAPVPPPAGKAAPATDKTTQIEPALRGPKLAGIASFPETISQPSSPASIAAPSSPPAPESIDPQALAHVTQGKAAQAKGDLSTAIGEYTQALILAPKYATAYSLRAAARQAKGDLPGAIADDSQFLTLQPDNANGFTHRGFLKQSTKDPDGAIADYTRALQLDPKSVTAIYNRGMVLEQKNQPDTAIADFNQALELDPRLAGAYYNRGNAKMDKSDLEGAIADYTNALQIDPKIALAFSNRGLAEQDLGNLLSAQADYTRALALDSNIVGAYYNRGLIEEQQNNLDACIDDSTKTVMLDPGNAQAYFNRGVALQAKGNLDAAGNDLRKFTELAPKNIYSDYAHLYLWVISNQQSRKSEADQDLSNCLETSWNADPEQLTSKIAKFLLDHLSESDLMALAISPDPKKNQIQHCEVWYFDGIKKMLGGNKTAAIGCFHQCVSTGEKDFCEYILAQAQLQSLQLAGT